MPTNTKESGFEALIVNWLVEHNGYEEGSNTDYNKEYAIDETRLFRFLQDTQPEQLEKLGIRKSHQKYAQFLNRLQGEISKRGIVDVLRNGIKVYPADLIMFYLTPSEGNAKAKELFQKNIFSVTRQLRYSQDAAKLALDLCVFINGLPVITFELKNQITKQNVDDAVQQYKDDRDSRELLFQFKRCMVHFAVDDARIKFCTKLAGKDSWFLPFDKGYNDGAGNPPNPNGIMTDYLWKDILTKERLTLIIENYAQVVVEVDEDTKKKKEKPKKEMPKITARAVLDSLPELWRILKKGLRMTFHRVRVAPMDISAVIGGDDPADTALLYGRLSAAMYTAMPMLQELVHMPDPHIHLEPELQGGETRISGEVGVSFLIWDLTVIGFACGVPLIHWLLRLRKQPPKAENDIKTQSGKDEQYGKQGKDQPQRNDGDLHEQGAGNGQQ